MAADNTKEIDRLKGLLGELMKRVPPSVTKGGLEYTTKYKAAVNAAKKVLSNARSTFISAQAAYTNLNSFWIAT